MEQARKRVIFISASAKQYKWFYCFQRRHGFRVQIQRLATNEEMCRDPTKILKGFRSELK